MRKTREMPEKKFLVAFSFAGEHRELVRSVADAVEKRLGFGTVFFDEWFEYYIAGCGRVASGGQQPEVGTYCRLCVGQLPARR